MEGGQESREEAMGRCIQVGASAVDSEKWLDSGYLLQLKQKGLETWGERIRGKGWYVSVTLSMCLHVGLSKTSVFISL